MVRQPAPDAPPFRFVYGSVALNLAGTLANRGSAEALERLSTPERLRDWIAEMKLTTDRARCDDRDLQRVRALRDALYGAALAVIDGGTPSRADVDALNDCAARPPVTERLSPRTLRLTKKGDIAAVLSTIARDGLDLLGSDRRERLRMCEMDDCGSIYLDDSRGFRRRWCSMEACGNRAKAAAFRARH